MNVNYDGNNYEAILLDMTDEVALVEVDGEIFEVEFDETVQLYNPYHDQLGRFAKRVGGEAVKSAAVGGVIGGAVGAVKGVFTKDATGKRLGATKGAIQGAVYGAKKGLVAGIVKESFNIGAEKAGNYGFAVKVAGGLAVAFAGGKGLTTLGVTTSDIKSIGASVAVSGLLNLVTKFEDADVTTLESNLGEKIQALSLFIAEGLDKKQKYIGTDIDLTPLGFKKKEDMYIMESDAAIDLLSALITYSEIKLEIEENEIIRLFNPYHDSLGRFASKAASAAGAGVSVGAVVGVSGLIGATLTRGIVYAKARPIAKERRKGSGKKGSTPSNKEVTEAFEDVLQQKIIDTTIGGKNISVTYEQVHRGFSKVSKIGFTGSAASVVLAAGLSVTPVFSKNKDYREGFYDDFSKRYGYRPDQGRKQSNQSQQRPSTKQWPRKATDDDFKKMYRKLSKKWHPDLNPKDRDDATRMQQKINDLYDKRDWYGIEDLFKKLEELFFSIILEEPTIPEDMFEFFGLFLRTLQEASTDDSDYVVFPHSGPKDEDFVYEDDELVLNRAMVEIILDTFVPKNKPKLEVDYSQFTMEL